MTFEQYIYQQTGYKCQTTFWSDFSIADRFGVDAVKDTFNRAFKSWRDDIEYLTELVLVLNHKIWYWYQKNDTLARVYDELWRKANDWAHENITDPEEAEYYFNTLD